MAYTPYIYNWFLSCQTDMKSKLIIHYSDVIMSAMASQIAGVSIVCPNVYPGADKKTHQSFASLAFVRGILRLRVDSPHKGPVTRKIFQFDDVIIGVGSSTVLTHNVEQRLFLRYILDCWLGLMFSGTSHNIEGTPNMWPARASKPVMTAW